MSTYNLKSQSPLSLSEALNLSKSEQFIQSNNVIVACDFDKDEFYFYTVQFLSKEEHGEDEDWFAFYMSGGICFSSCGTEAHFGGMTQDDAVADGKVNHCDITNLAWYVVPEFDSEMMTEYVFQSLFSFPCPDEYWQDPAKKSKIILDAKTLIKKLNKYI
jgi:hypothetical protein